MFFSPFAAFSQRGLKMQLCARECSRAALNILITTSAQEEMDAEREEKRHSRLEFSSFFCLVKCCTRAITANYITLSDSLQPF